MESIRPSVNLTLFLVQRQDLWLLLLGAVMLRLCGLALKDRHRAIGGLLTRSPILPAMAILVACLLGHFLVLCAYDLSRDEQMASFDASVFAGGHLVQRLPALWRDHADALNTMFMYPANPRVAWISSYLPMNAVWRALIGVIATPALASPLMTGLGAWALWACARRIWPEDREAAIVALLLYVGSGQVLVTGMTSYAMTGHLTLNLIWLALFLRRHWWADLAALLIGMVAVGLHQPLMHPMFAAPILCLCLIDKQWRRAAFFAIGYSAIGAFWMMWPHLMAGMVQAPGSSAVQPGVGYLSTLVEIVKLWSPSDLPIMLANLLRFLAWQHLLLLPLMGAALGIARRDRLAGALAAGVLLTICVMLVILPYQGHGFGYRYLHGLIGNCILLAVFGWRKLVEAQPTWRVLLLRTSAASMVIVLPVQLWMAHNFYAPYATADAKIAASSADYAVIGWNDVPFSVDLVHNSPDLAARPMRLVRELISPAVAVKLCASHPSVALVDDSTLRPIADYYRFAGLDQAERRNAALAPLLTRAGCRVSFLD